MKKKTWRSSYWRESQGMMTYFLRYKKTEILPLPNFRGFSVFSSLNMRKEEKERENFEWERLCLG